MTDYSKLSDFEINKLVAISTGHKQFSSLGWQGLQDGDFNAVMVRGPMKIGGFDPCNNPEDAWPIIVENKIAIYPNNKSASSWMARASFSEISISHWNENPLRAAMIVFLMMQENRE